MDTFLIRGSSGDSSLEFSERELGNPGREQFTIRVTGPGLSAEARVDLPGAVPRPDQIFAEMARRWSGWSGDLTWESLEHDLTLRCSRDRLGHVTILVELESDPVRRAGWSVRIPLVVEAGQLEGLAKKAQVFFAS